MEKATGGGCGAALRGRGQPASNGGATHAGQQVGSGEGQGRGSPAGGAAHMWPRRGRVCAASTRGLALAGPGPIRKRWGTCGAGGRRCRPLTAPQETSASMASQAGADSLRGLPQPCELAPPAPRQGPCACCPPERAPPPSCTGQWRRAHPRGRRRACKPRQSTPGLLIGRGSAATARVSGEAGRCGSCSQEGEHLRPPVRLCVAGRSTAATSGQQVLQARHGPMHLQLAPVP